MTLSCDRGTAGTGKVKEVLDPGVQRQNFRCTVPPPGALPPYPTLLTTMGMVDHDAASGSGNHRLVIANLNPQARQDIPRCCSLSPERTGVCDRGEKEFQRVRSGLSQWPAFTPVRPPCSGTVSRRPKHGSLMTIRPGLSHLAIGAPAR
jgi:hypothetical protein